MDGFKSGGWSESAVPGAMNVLYDGGWCIIEVGSSRLAGGSVVSNKGVYDGWGGEGGFAVDAIDFGVNWVNGVNCDILF